MALNELKLNFEIYRPIIFVSYLKYGDYKGLMIVIIVMSHINKNEKLVENICIIIRVLC